MDPLNNIPELMDCPICMEPLVGDKVTLACSHIFHQKCIDAWNQNKNTCPLCRTHIIKVYSTTFSSEYGRQAADDGNFCPPFSKRTPPWSLNKIKHNASVLSKPTPGATFYVDPAGDLQVDKRWFYQRWFGPGDATSNRISAVALTTLRLVAQAVECEYLKKDRIAEHNGIWMDNREFMRNLYRNISEPPTYEYFADNRLGGRRKSDHELTNFQLNSKKIQVVLQILEDGFQYYTNSTAGIHYELPDEESTTDVLKWLSAAEEKLPDLETELNALRIKVAEASSHDEQQVLIQKYWALYMDKCEEEGQRIQIQCSKMLSRMAQNVAEKVMQDMRAQFFGI